jgi:hypothetical protein
MILRTTKIFFKKASSFSAKNSLYLPLYSSYPLFSTIADNNPPIEDETKKKRKRRKKSTKDLEELEDSINEPIDPKEVIHETVFEEKIEREKLWVIPPPDNPKIIEPNTPEPKTSIFILPKKKQPEPEKTENTEQKTSVFMKQKQDITNKMREISDLQTMKGVVSFIEKPQNKILLLAEKQTLYEKIMKLMSLQNIDLQNSVIPPLKEFFNRYKVTLKSAEDARYYIGIFSLSINKVTAAAFEDFYLDCVDEMLKLPKFKAGVGTYFFFIDLFRTLWVFYQTYTDSIMP